jgi:drug/metabolite transporter (DMT)-like permease
LSLASSIRGRLSGVDGLLLAVALVWGSSYLVAKELTNHAPIAGLLSLRFGSAALLMFGIWAVGRALGKRERFSKWDVRLGALYGLLVGTIMWIETNSIHMTSATNAGLIISLTIIFTPIIEGAWARNWLPPMFFVAAVGAVVGVALLVSAGGFANLNLGDFIMFGAAIIRAWTTTIQGRFAKGKTLSSFNVTVVQFAVIGIGYALIAPNALGQTIVSFGGQQWLELAYLVLFCSVFGFVGLMVGIRRTSATRASLLLSTEPVWAVVVAAGFGGETLGWLGALGAAMIIGFSYWGLSIEASWRQPTQPEQ